MTDVGSLKTAIYRYSRDDTAQQSSRFSRSVGIVLHLIRKPTSLNWFFARKFSLKWLFVCKYRTIVPRYLYYCGTIVVSWPRDGTGAVKKTAVLLQCRSTSQHYFIVGLLWLHRSVQTGNIWLIVADEAETMTHRIVVVRVYYPTQ